jgi:hypothetical protein
MLNSNLMNSPGGCLELSVMRSFVTNLIDRAGGEPHWAREFVLDKMRGVDKSADFPMGVKAAGFTGAGYP